MSGVNIDAGRTSALTAAAQPCGERCQDLLSSRLDLSWTHFNETPLIEDADLITVTLPLLRLPRTDRAEDTDQPRTADDTLTRSTRRFWASMNHYDGRC